MMKSKQLITIYVYFSSCKCIQFNHPVRTARYILLAVPKSRVLK